MLRLVRVVLLLAAVCAMPVRAEPLRVEQVAPGVYVHSGQHKDFEDGYDGDIANIGFVVGTRAVAVIDTGGAYAVGLALKEALRGITRLPIRYVINTHAHPDHVFGNAAFLEPDPARAPRFIGHAKLPRALALRGDAYLRKLRQQLGSAAAGSSLVPPNDTVAERMVLDLGGRQLVLQAWPNGHTDNDLSVLDAATGTLWTGDLLFIGRAPAVDGDIKGWLAVTDRLATLPAARIIPGHGPVTRDKRQALARQRTYLATLLRDVRSGIRQGRSLTDTMESAAAEERGRWQLFDVVNRRNVNLIYPQLEWE